MLNSFVQSIGLLVLRLSFGGMMLYGHGLMKFQSYSSLKDQFPDPIGVGSQVALVLAILAEFFCSIFVILGLGTRLAAIPLAATMLVALMLIHGDDPWQKKELAAVYLSAFVCLIIMGGGSFSLDRVLTGWRKKPKQS